MMTSLIERDVAIAAGDKVVRGTLVLPGGAAAVVVFAHGSGSGRFSPRNQYVARVLQEGGLGTLLVDLLEENEADDRASVFDIALLAGRLRSAAGWLAAQPETARMRLGYFGASTGAGAALLAAGQEPDSVGAIVSRGGRPDLARDVLPRVTAPTRLIVGGNDEIVLELNREAYELLAVPPPARHRPRCLAPVSRAGHARRSRPAGPGVVSPVPHSTRRDKFNSSLDRPERSGYRRSGWSRNESVVR